MPVKKENAFKYLMDNNESIAEQNIRIIGLTNFKNSPQLYKKTSYSVRKIKTSGSNNYYSIISFNSLTIDNDDYSLIIEWYHPERYNRFVNVTGSNINILEHFSHEYHQYIRSLVQFTKNNDNTPNRIRVHLKGTILGSDTNGHLILYGIQGLFDSVSVNVYDDHFTVLENSLKYNLNINMNNNRIFNIGGPVNNKDSVNINDIKTNIGAINIYGNVNQNGVFQINNTDFNFNAHIHILSIELINTTALKNTSDALEMVVTGNLNNLVFRFTYSEHSNITYVNIYRTFSVSINDIHLQKGRNLPFVIKYQPFAI